MIARPAAKLASSCSQAIGGRFSLYSLGFFITPYNCACKGYFCSFPTPPYPPLFSPDVLHARSETVLDLSTLGVVYICRSLYRRQPIPPPSAPPCMLLLLVLTAVRCLHFLVLVCVSKLGQQVDNHFDWSRVLSSIFHWLSRVTWPITALHQGGHL